MACECCEAARQWPGTRAARQYDPSCLWCGARYIRMLSGHPVGPGAVREWRRKILATWTALGHAEAQLRELAAADALPLDPQPWRRGGAK